MLGHLGLTVLDDSGLQQLQIVTDGAPCVSVRAAELTLNIVQDRIDILSMLACFLPVVEGTGAPMLASVTRLVKATGSQPRVSSTSMQYLHL